MTAPPVFASNADYVNRLADADFWRPHIDAILHRHNRADARHRATAGIGATYPTFLCGEVVVKLFGHRRLWRTGYEAERAAYALLATDPEIAAPRVVGEGRLYDDPDAPWPYLMTTRMPGVAWEDAAPTGEERRAVAEDLGRQLRRVHALRPAAGAVHEDWDGHDLVDALKVSSLPPHLIAQAEGFVTRLGPFDRVFVHGDVMFRHVFVRKGRLVGLVDWGDAMVTDRHYELAKLHLDLFDCDRTLLHAFLRASDWPVASDFAAKAMGMALCRQWHGVAQHHSMDVFYKLPALVPLAEIATLDKLAVALFDV